MTILILCFKITGLNRGIIIKAFTFAIQTDKLCLGQQGFM